MHCLEPQELTPGWKKRTIKNALTLLWKHPLLLVPPVLFPLLATMISTSVLTALASMVVMWCLMPVFIIKADRGHDMPLRTLIRRMAGNWGTFVGALGGLLVAYVMLSNQASLFAIQEATIGGVLKCNSIAAIALLLAILIFKIAMLAPLIISLAAGFVFRRREIAEIGILLNSLPGNFTVFLLAEHGTSTIDAIRLSRLAREINENNGLSDLALTPSLTAVLTTLILSPFLSCSVILDYFLYKEIFCNDKGLHEKSPVKQSLNAGVTAGAAQ